MSTVCTHPYAFIPLYYILINNNELISEMEINNTVYQNISNNKLIIQFEICAKLELNQCERGNLSNRMASTIAECKYHYFATITDFISLIEYCCKRDCVYIPPIFSIF